MTDIRNTPAQEGPAFKGLDAPFLRRTLVATLITLGLVALNAYIYFDRGWAGRYLFAGVWTLLFFGLTPLIIKEALFEKRMLRVMGLIAAKIALLIVLGVACAWWLRIKPDAVNFGSSLVAGVSTPLIVVVLRAIGSQMESHSVKACL